MYVYVRLPDDWRDENEWEKISKRRKHPITHRHFSFHLCIVSPVSKLIETLILLLSLFSANAYQALSHSFLIKSIFVGQNIYLERFLSLSAMCDIISVCSFRCWCCWRGERCLVCLVFTWRGSVLRVAIYKSINKSDSELQNRCSCRHFANVMMMIMIVIAWHVLVIK